MTAAAPSFGAILLAGGRATRVGGASKPLFEVGGKTLLGAAVDAVREAGAHPISVAAPLLDPALGVDWVREDPPFGGPVAATVAVLEEWAASGIAPHWTFLLACDLPEVGAAVRRLAADVPLLPRDADGLCLGDAASRPQWLTGVYRTRALEDAASALPDRGRDASVRALLADLAITVVVVPGDLTADVDTWEDLEEARARTAARMADGTSARPEQDRTPAVSRTRGGVPMTEQTRTLPPEALDKWAAALREHFGLGTEDVPISLILDLARDVANGVARPAAPLSAFVAGLVAGRAGGMPTDAAAAVAAITELAGTWEA